MDKRKIELVKDRVKYREDVNEREGRRDRWMKGVSERD